MQVCYVHGFSGDKDTLSLGNYSQATFRLSRFPATESKYHSKIGYFGRMLLEYEYDTMVPIGPGVGSLSIESGTTEPDGPKFRCTGNLPNPFNPATLLCFTIPEKMVGETFNVSIYDVQGKVICAMDIPVKHAGQVNVIWNGKDSFEKETASGVYMARYTIKGKTSGKIKLVKIK